MSDNQQPAFDGANLHAHSNVASSEVDKFNGHAQQWWDEFGPLKTLHQVNPVRINWIGQHVSLKGKRVLDVGCGGGLLTEALALYGALAEGVDMAPDSIAVAQAHAQVSQLDIQYHVSTAEDLVLTYPKTFDVVTCMEMLEHVPHPESVIASCAQLVKSGGYVFFSTLNRQPKALALGIVTAEYLLGWIPRGTHDYKTFIKPSELTQVARSCGLHPVDIKGIGYDPRHLLDKTKPPFRISDDVGVNYMMVFRKQ